MNRAWAGAAAVTVLLGGCELNRTVIGVEAEPAPPREVGAYYYAGAVTVTWELAPDWDGEVFRVYGKRSTDGDYYLVAEVTSCAGGACAYTDTNIQAGRIYHYYVATVDTRSGLEAASSSAVEVAVPHPLPPPVPADLGVVALDHANYLSWASNAHSEADFSHYRVYLRAADGASYLLGETDLEGFLDQLAQNGLTYTYFVTALDELGHESAGSAVAEGTPRPDYEGEWIYDYFDRPADSGFRFRTSDVDDPVVSGDDPLRHFRLETDASGWWLVPGPGADVYPWSWTTSALKCGVAADPGCSDLTEAPTSGYVRTDLELLPQSTYVLRVEGDDGQARYGALRVILLGTDQDGHGLMIFDWAYQLQPGNPALAPQPTAVR